MKYLAYTLIASLLAYLLIMASSCSFKKEPFTGYIEIISDYDIQRIDLLTGRGQEVFKKTPDYLIHNFDLSPNGEDRVLAVSGVDQKPERLIMYLKDRKPQTMISRNFVRWPSFSPDGKAIAYLFNEYQDNPKNWFADWYLNIVKLDGFSNRRLFDMALDNEKPSWFPDGRKLAVGTKDLKIFIVDVETGANRELIDFGTKPTVSHDGKKIAFLKHDIDEAMKAKIIELRAMTKAEYHKKVMGKKKYKDVDVEKIERLLVHHSIYIYDVDSGTSKKIANELPIERAVVWSPDDYYLIYNDETYLGHDIYVLDVRTGKKEKIDNLHGKVMVWRRQE